MSDQNNQQIQLRIDESRMRTSYANTIRTSTTPDEVIMDFGVNMPVPTPDNKPMLVFDVSSRIVMYWRMTLPSVINLNQGNVIRRWTARTGG